MASLISVVTAQLGFTFTEESNGFSASFSPSFGGTVTFANGTGKDQANMLWYDVDRSLAGTTNDDIDLSGTGFMTAFNVNAVFSIVRGLFIQLKTETVGVELQVGNHATAPFLLFKDDAESFHSMGPGGKFLVEEPSLAGLPVTATTADILRIRNSGATTIAYDIAIWGS